MKNTIFALFLLISLTINAQSKKEVKWLYNYEKVLKKAKRNNKPIIVYFSGSDWCAPCKRLKKDLFESEEFSKMSKDYNLLYVDIPQNQDLISEKQYKKNKKLLGDLNPNKNFPAVIILNKRGNEQERINGYSSIATPEKHLNIIKKYK